MGDPPAYPPPPDQPPAGYEPAPSRPPTAHPAVAYPVQSPPPVKYRISRRLWVVIAAIVVVVALLVGTIAYVFAGFAYMSARISAGENAINAVNAHRSFVNTTFDLLDQQVGSFETLMDSRVGKSTSGQVVSESQSINTTVASNDRPLATARSSLNDQQWLTAINSRRLAAEADRIDHANNAVATLKSGAGDYVLLGQFFQAWFQSVIDWDTMVTDLKNNDFVGAAGADVTLQSDAAKALQVASAPGLPKQYPDFLTILQAYAADVGTEFNARTKPAQDAAFKLIDADVAKLVAINFTGTSAEIKSYYEHFRVDFNSELDKATA